MTLVRRPDSCRDRKCVLRARLTAREAEAEFDHNGQLGLFFVPSHRLLEDLHARDFNAPLLAWIEAQHNEDR